MDISDVKSNAQQIQGVLNKLKIPDSMKKGFETSFNSVYSTVDKISEKLQNGFKTKGDVSGLSKLTKDLEKSFGEITKLTEELSKESGVELNLDFNQEGIKKAQQAVKEFQESLQENRQGVQGFQELSDAIDQVNKASKTNAAKDLKKSLQELDFSRAEQDIQGLVNSLTNFDKKSETSQNAAKYQLIFLLMQQEKIEIYLPAYHSQKCIMLV